MKIYILRRQIPILCGTEIFESVLIFDSPVMLTGQSFILYKCVDEYLFRDTEETERRMYTWKTQKVISFKYLFLNS